LVTTHHPANAAEVVKGGVVKEWQNPGDRTAVRTAVRFPLRLALHLKTEDGMIEATTRDISSNGLLFAADRLPRVGSSIEFSMEMPSEVMGWSNDVSIRCTGRIVRHQLSEHESMAAAVIDEYSLKA
jgi:hypothetical protein